MNTFLRIDSQHIDSLIRHLNELLANYHLHYQNMRNFHWNVYGEQFFELHKQFELAYNQAKTHIDEIAERILTLGFRPVSNFSEYLYIAKISEPTGVLKPHEMVESTLKDFRHLIVKMNEVIQIAEEAQDEGTADMVTGFLKAYEKKHWQFHAFLKMQPAA